MTRIDWGFSSIFDVLGFSLILIDFNIFRKRSLMTAVVEPPMVPRSPGGAGNMKSYDFDYDPHARPWKTQASTLSM